MYANFRWTPQRKAHVLWLMENRGLSIGDACIAFNIDADIIEKWRRVYQPKEYEFLPPIGKSNGKVQGRPKDVGRIELMAEYLRRHAGKVVTRRQLMEAYGSRATDEKVIDVQMCYLRRKYPSYPIVTIWGEGFMWEKDNETAGNAVAAAYFDRSICTDSS